MKYYELTYFLALKLTEDEVKKFSEEINSFIQEKRGIVEKDYLKTGVIKKRLPSPIKGEADAYLNTVTFHLPVEEIEALKTKLSSEQQILRYIILNKKPLKRVKTPKTLPKISRIEKEAKPAPKKVDLKEIEKKLEEILEE